MNLLQDHAFQGAMAGFALGSFDYVLIRWMLSRAPAPESREEIKQRQTMKTILILATVIGFPICGYLVGPYILPGLFG